jgi:hypothetical protein
MVASYFEHGTRICAVEEEIKAASAFAIEGSCPCSQKNDTASLIPSVEHGWDRVLVRPISCAIVILWTIKAADQPEFV